MLRDIKISKFRQILNLSIIQVKNGQFQMISFLQSTFQTQIINEARVLPLSKLKSSSRLAAVIPQRGAYHRSQGVENGTYGPSSLMVKFVQLSVVVNVFKNRRLAEQN